MLTLPVRAASREGPEDFVHRVYARYRTNGLGVAMDRPDGAAFYTAAMLDAFRHDTASPAGAGVTVEWDPICDCHAVSTLRMERVTIGERTADSAAAHVAFTNAGTLHHVTLRLSRTPAGWRIADIGVKDASYQDVDDRDVGSMLALLRRPNASTTARSPRLSPGK